MATKSKIRTLRALYLASFIVALGLFVVTLLTNDLMLSAVAAIGVIHFGFKTEQMFNITERTFDGN